ncbi:MAG: IS3 family transposase [Chloroflexota bacterium]
MCKKLNVSPSGYYAWLNRPESKRSQEDAKLLVEIKKIHQESMETYGYCRIYQALIALGQKASRFRIARLMRQHQLRGKQFRQLAPTRLGLLILLTFALVKDSFILPLSLPPVPEWLLAERWVLD